jgi:predicted DNA-binding protein
MGITTSFTFSDDFKALLDKVSKDHGKTKTALP